jgi:hypothetical protein
VVDEAKRGSVEARSKARLDAELERLEAAGADLGELRTAITCWVLAVCVGGEGRGGE